jgi:sarcosine oxidase subunit alpha
MQRRRLPAGGRIDRSRPLQFRFDGRSYEGFAGDTLASALLANGVSIVGRSFKLRRPRGIVGSGSEEPNAIMQIGKGAHAQPNLRATQVELYDGLVARTTRGWPGAKFDLGAVNDMFGKVLGAGFYYKTFMRPKSWWHLYERFIRASAGFGRAPTKNDPDRYEHVNAHCDVLIAGGGPAGLAAALAAGKSGARVILADEQSEFGGSLLATRRRVENLAAADWIRQTVELLATLDNVRLLPRSTVFGYYDHNFLAMAERCTDHLPEKDRSGIRQRLWRVRAKRVVLAQGAFERPLAFCNNDRPGVMLASAVSAYVNRYAVRPGRRAVVFTNNDSAYETALDLVDAGCTVVIVDSRSSGAGSLAEQAANKGVSVLTGHVVTDVAGRRRVRGVRVAGWSGNPSYLVESTIQIECDQPVGRGAALLRAGRNCAGQCLGRRLQRSLVVAGLPARRHRGRHGRGGALRIRHARHRFACDGGRLRQSPAAALARALGSGAGALPEAIPRLPERYQRGGHSAGCPRRLPQRRACQAVHGSRLRY